jgi:hypothetical protein
MITRKAVDAPPFSRDDVFIAAPAGGWWCGLNFRNRRAIISMRISGTAGDDT